MKGGNWCRFFMPCCGRPRGLLPWEEEIRCQSIFSPVGRAIMMHCRVGKGRPAGSIELRVSPSPS